MATLLPLVMWPGELCRTDKSVRLQGGFPGWWGGKASFVSLVQIPTKSILRRHLYMDSLRGVRSEGWH